MDFVINNIERKSKNNQKTIDYLFLFNSSFLSNMKFVNESEVDKFVSEANGFSNENVKSFKEFKTSKNKIHRIKVEDIAFSDILVIKTIDDNTAKKVKKTLMEYKDKIFFLMNTKDGFKQVQALFEKALQD
jgi:hypothetical protein